MSLKTILVDLIDDLMFNFEYTSLTVKIKNKKYTRLVFHEFVHIL